MINTVNVSKKLNNKLIISDTSFTVSSGRIVGLCGQNGSGKTTLIKLLLGIYEPDSGQIELDSNEKKAVFDTPPSIGNVSVKDYLDFFALLYKGSKLSSNERIELLKRCNLQLYENKKIAQLSYGMKKLLYISSILIGKSKLIVLDEPFNGLDAASINAVKQMCAQIRDTQSSTIILSSHLLGELDDFCDDFLQLQLGKTSVSNSAFYKGKTIRLTADLDIPSDIYDNLCLLGQVKKLRDGVFDIELFDGKTSSDIINFLMLAGIKFSEIYYAKKIIHTE